MSAQDSSGSTPQDLTGQVRGDLSGAAEQAKHDLGAIGQRAAEDVRALGDEASARVGEATEKAKSFASDQKDLAATQISGVAAAIGRVADELESSDQPAIGRYARDLASGITGLGQTIEKHDVDDLMGMAQDFGRKQPLAFLGAAALAGFVASRFSIASSHRRDAKSASGQPPQPQSSDLPNSGPSQSFGTGE